MKIEEEEKVSDAQALYIRNGIECIGLLCDPEIEVVVQ